LTVDPTGKFTYLANFFFNSVSAYSINSNGALAAVPGDPFPTNEPTSVAVDPTGKFAYVTNSLNYGVNGTISAYSIGSNGALTQIPGSPFSAGEGPRSIAISPLPSPAFQASKVPVGGTTFAASAALEPSKVTVAAWVTTAPGPVTNYPAFVSYGLDSSPYESYILQAKSINGQNPADFFFLTGSGQGHQIFGQTHLQPNTQYFLAATYDGATAKIYLNGNKENTISVSGALYYPGSGVFGLGVARKYSAQSANFFGTETGVEIYDSALTASQIYAVYLAGPGGALDPTVIFHSSEVAAGGETLPASAALQPSVFSIEAFVNASSTQTNYPAFVSYGQDTSPYESYVLQASTIDGTHPADFYMLTGSGQGHQVFGQTHLRPGIKYFLAATYSGASIKLYVNGMLEGSTPVSGLPYYPGSGGLGLARKYSVQSANFSGTESGVSLYNRVLTAAEIAADYAAGPH
jgi:hypothetical protein